MTISKVIVVHAFLASFVQSLPAPAPVVVSPVCEGIPVEECKGSMGQYIMMLCPDLCFPGPYSVNKKGEILKIVVSAVKEALNENEEALDEVVGSPMCEGIPVEKCKGGMGQYIMMLCPDLCFPGPYSVNKKGEVLKIVVSAVKEALNKNEKALDEVVVSPVCEGIPVEECKGGMGQYIMMLCPDLCFPGPYSVNKKGEVLKIVVSAVKEALNKNEEALDEGEVLKIVDSAVKEALNKNEEAPDEGEVLKIVVSAVKEALNKNEEALDEVVASPVCEGIPVEECNGDMGEYIKKLCPTMCTAASPVCEGIPVEECDGDMGEYIKTLCPTMCSADEIALDSITSVKIGKDHESCLVLDLSDCDGDHADLVKKNCPGMCAVAKAFFGED